MNILDGPPVVRQTIGARIKEMVEEAIDGENVRGKKAEFARRIGVTEAAVGQWISGDTGQPRGTNLVRIEKEFGYLPRWIISGEGPKKRTHADRRRTEICSLGELVPESKLDLAVEFLKHLASSQ